LRNRNQTQKEERKSQYSIREIATYFVYFIESYAHHFEHPTGSSFSQAQTYLCGLIQAEKKNIERMIEVVPESEYESEQHFISNSPWSYRSVLDQVAQDSHKVMENDQDRALFVDESGHVKKGKQSVGVKRQWCGRVGKVENCQVGVYTSLNCREQTTLIDSRLYLPEDWAKDEQRCLIAGIPKEEIVYKTKCQLALESIRHQRSQGIAFNWVGVDGNYGKDPAFLRSLDEDGETFMADVHSDQRFYLKNPTLPSKREVQREFTQVDQWTRQQPQAAWKTLRVRDTTKGFLEIEVLTRQVWLWNGEEEKAHQWHLIVRREKNSPNEIKYSLSNAPKYTKVKRLAFMQAQRFWVEQALKNGKSETGMSDYQVRGWLAWNHHMALVLVAMLFMLQTRLLQQKDYPLLSCTDIEVLLKHFLPRRDVTVEEVMRQMEVRHKQRQKSIENAYRKQKYEKRFIFGNWFSPVISMT